MPLVSSALHTQVDETDAVHIIQHKRRSHVGLEVTQLDIAHLQSLHVPDEKSVRRQLTKHRRLRIQRFPFRRIERGLFLRSAALRVDANVAEAHVFDQITRNAADDRRVLRIGVVDHDVADDHAPQSADFRRLPRATQTRAESQKDGRVADVTHRDVGDRDVFQQRAVDGFKCKPARVVENAVVDGDVFETAV